MPDAAALVRATAAPATAVTVKNTSAGEFTIGVDMGASEKGEPALQRRLGRG